MDDLDLEALGVRTLGPCKIDTPLLDLVQALRTSEHYVDESDRVLFDDTGPDGGRAAASPVDELPGFEPSGPRRKIYFDPSKTRVGIVTCGGLCPGLNDVIRALVLELTYHYGVREGLRLPQRLPGLHRPVPAASAIDLTPESVSDINEYGGTILGTSRGAQDPEEIVDCLERMGVNILFVIGGDGSMRGALQIAEVIERARSQDRGGRRAEDDRQRHPVHRPELRLPDRVRQGDRVDPGRPRRGPAVAERRRPGQADGPALRLHRLLRRAGQQRRRLRADPRGRRSSSTARTGSCAHLGDRVSRTRARRGRRRRGRRTGVPRRTSRGGPTPPATPGCGDFGAVPAQPHPGPLRRGRPRGST